MNLKSITLSFNTVKKIRRLPGTWTTTDFQQLLTLLEVDDAGSYSEADAADMAIMALQDLEPEEAAKFILTHFAESRFSRGQAQNLAEELKEEQAWEEYPNIDHQRALYVCVDVLNQAFPNDYPEPSACEVGLTMSGADVAAAHARSPLQAAILLRAIGRCQDDRSILNRFFGAQVNGAPFPEAASVVWQLDTTPVRADQLAITCCGSAYWFRGLDDEDEATCGIEWP